MVDYLDRAGLTEYLDALRFNLVGFGCTTCIGNSGPLPDEVSRRDLASTTCRWRPCSRATATSRRRIHPQVRANYLASPPLVVAYALAGSVNIDLTSEPLGSDRDGKPVMLRRALADRRRGRTGRGRRRRTPSSTPTEYGRIFDGDERWRALPVPTGELFAVGSRTRPTCARPPSSSARADLSDIVDARRAGDPGRLGHDRPHLTGRVDPRRPRPAGRYLIEHGVEPREFNSYGARRGNHEVMVRGTFANIRLRNRIVEGVEGGFTRHFPDGEQMSIYDASMRYQADGVPLVVIAGKEYGSGSSRDWAAKGSALLGVRAVIAESYERIHRTNLVALGVIPLQFLEGDSAESLGITGTETFTIRGLGELEVGSEVTVELDGGARSFRRWPGWTLRPTSPSTARAGCCR